MPKAAAKKLKITLSIVIENEEGMNRFARMLRVLADNGYESTVRSLVRMLVAAAKKRGVTVPPDLEKL